MVVSTPGLHSRESEKLQHLLLHVAQIFAKWGYQGASDRETRRGTGASLRALCYYFESKQKLLYRIRSSVFTLLVHRFRERLRVMVDSHIEYFLLHPAERKVVWQEEAAFVRRYSTEVATIKRRHDSLAREIFRRVSAQGKTLGLNLLFAVLSLFGMMNWIYKWHNPEVDAGAEGLAGTILAIFLRGLRRTREPGLQLPVAGAEAQGQG